MTRDWLKRIAIIDDGGWMIRATEEELDEIMRLAKSAATLSARVSELEKALEFYARIGVPKGCSPVGDDFGKEGISRDPYWQDQGKIARKALGWGVTKESTHDSNGEERK